MKETLNQDTEPHESCQPQSWRRGMGPSVAAYEWLTDSQCCWHKLKKCEEVVKISAGSRCIAWKPASVRNEQTQKLHAPFVTLDIFTESHGGGHFCACYKTLQHIHNTWIQAMWIVCCFPLEDFISSAEGFFILLNEMQKIFCRMM